MSERREKVLNIVKSFSPTSISLQDLTAFSTRPVQESGVTALSFVNPSKEKTPIGITSKIDDDSSSKGELKVAPVVVMKGKILEVRRVAGGSRDRPQDKPMNSIFSEPQIDVKIEPWEEKLGWQAEKVFWEYFNKSEDPEGWNRRWDIERDVPWDAVRREPISQDAALMVESFYAVESYLPDFAEQGLGYYRKMVGLSHSHINWSYEELKHGRTLQLVLERSESRTPQETQDFRMNLARKQWTMPYPTPRQMLIYAAFQEKETNRNYEHLRDVLASEGAMGAAQALRIIGRDEAFHHAFYKDIVKMMLEHDEVGTARDIQVVAQSFRMPAQHLMPNMEDRVRVMIRKKVFGKKQVRDEAILPTIRAFGFRDPAELESVASVKDSLPGDSIVTVDPQHDASESE